MDWGDVGNVAAVVVGAVSGGLAVIQGGWGLLASETRLRARIKDYQDIVARLPAEDAARVEMEKIVRELARRLVTAERSKGVRSAKYWTVVGVVLWFGGSGLSIWAGLANVSAWWVVVALGLLVVGGVSYLLNSRLTARRSAKASKVLAHL